MKCYICGKEIPSGQCIRCGRPAEKGTRHCDKCEIVNQLNIERDKKFRMMGNIPPKWEQIMAETTQGLDARCDECREQQNRDLEWDKIVHLEKLQRGLL
jgi:hypothetical protein